MKISIFFSALNIRRVVLSLLLAGFAGAAFAQSTTSAIRVVVTDQSGSPVGGVSVSVTHVPTGRSQIKATNDQGYADTRGLAVGGPYLIELLGGNQYADDVVQDVNIELGRTEIVELTARPAVEEILVLGEAVTQEVIVGVGRQFDREAIDATPSISRDFVSTIARDPKILVDNSVDRGPAVSMAGQNFRFNSITIDGVAQNDNFGLSKNASATQRAPISIDAIEAINVNLAPYDVTFGSFIGGNINIVTKSGTNEFEGSVYAFRTDDGLTGNESEGEKLGIKDFDEEVYGFTLGGPIVRDKAFFFVNYEKFETTRPSNSQTIENIVGVTQADVDRVIDIFQTEYGFDPGTFDATDVDEDEKILVKLDWNINDEHRAVASYQRADGDVLFDDFPDLAVLQSNRYNINETLDAYSIQLFSDWSDSLSTELKIGTKQVKNRQVSIDSSTPDFAILAPGFGTITAGGDRFRHNNKLDNESDQLRFKADYLVGEHVITAGLERQAKQTVNTFVPFTRGQFLFFPDDGPDGIPGTLDDRSGIDNFEQRNIGLVLFGGSTTGVVADAVGKFELVTNSVFVQDEWTVNDELILKFGFRYDKHSNDDEVPLNPSFAARNPFDNTFNLDGNDLFMPRFGFDWTPTDRLSVRGGAGLFGGGEPLIMLSNSYQGNGITRNIVCGPCIGEAFGVLDELAAALPSPTIAFELLQEFNGVNPDSDVEAISPDFETLSTWKYSLGATYIADLSRIGLGDEWSLSAEIIFSDVKDGFNVRELRRDVAGTAPDGRNIYTFTPGGDYVLENTNRGGGTVFTFDLAKSWYTDSGMFDVTFGYTHSDIEEVRSYDRFVTFESYAFDATTDFNNMPLSPSLFQVKNRVTATFDWQHTLFGDNVSRVSMLYTGRSGRNFSYTFGSGNAAFGGTFLADFGSEGDNPGSHLFYVPTGLTDPIVTADILDLDFLADLNEFIDSDSCLKGKRGQIVGRNACTTDFTNVISLRLSQEIPLWSDKKLELILDIENLGNLLNDNWGRVESYPAPSNVALANVSISGDGSQYIYSPISTDQVSPDTIAPDPAIARLPSVYRIQFGARFRF
ncbi:MAG: TonB-dependent receptor [Woeseiaceae bacterium]|nr:TonB-dependent receptor [Woeseiaceae bacterium]